MKKIAVLLVVLMFVLTISCSAESSGSAVGDKAYDFEIEDYDGNLVKLSDYLGKTVFLLAWTTT